MVWTGLWLTGMLRLAGSSIPTTKTFSEPAVRLFRFLTIRVFTGAALLISPRTHLSRSQPGRPFGARGPASGLFQLSTTFLTELPHVWLLIESGRRVTLPFTWTRRGHRRAINWPNCSIVVSRGTGRPEERWRRGSGRRGEQTEHTQDIYRFSFPTYMGAVRGVPRQ